jgi:trehalose synthase
VPGLSSVSVGEREPERFESVLSSDQYERLQAGISRAREIFAGRTIWHVNSTARGGGVAEMLTALLPYARGAGVDVRWVVVEGDPDFFVVTKRIHNRLHGAEGDGGPLGDDEHAVYERALAAAGEDLAVQVGERDLVVLHDPQTAGLVARLRQTGARVVWRCHVGLDTPNDHARDAWRFLRAYVTDADAWIFSREQFVWEDLDTERAHVIAPTIDAFSPKNEELGEDAIAAVREQVGLEDGERYVLQVSRWDRLKDPLGVIEGFAEHVAPHTDAHLVYAGPAVDAVDDDPEGAEVLEEARALHERLPEDVRARVHLALLPMDDVDENARMVNALQRGADVVVQKSIAEGFGLTVAEAMWKSRPVVASRIGGIQDQIEDGRSGVLLDDPADLAAYGTAVRELLEDPNRAAQMGATACDRVRERFLGTQSLLDYLDLLAGVLASRAAAGPPEATPAS